MLRFICLPMGEVLMKNGKFGSGSEDRKKRVPKIIRNLLNTAFHNYHRLSDSQEGKIGLAWLLGYFDGDGTVYYNRKGYKFSGEIISSSKGLLDDIRNLYKIKNVLGFKDKKQKTYRLAIGADLYREMMAVYSNSMQRKRPNYCLARFKP